VFYAAVAPLLAFYALFAAVIYPAAPALHLDAAAMLGAVPTGLHGLVKVVSNWTYSLFFCFAELWGSVVISVLFWWVRPHANCGPHPTRARGRDPCRPVRRWAARGAVGAAAARRVGGHAAVVIVVCACPRRMPRTSLALGRKHAFGPGRRR
jgi:hypothetical protein